MTVIPPNYTLYIRGLDDKRSKKGLMGTHKDLKECLYFLFSQHGRVLDVVCLKTMKQRGQAFVCFNEIEEASSAMRSLQGFPLFEKPMIIQYAKDKSNVIKIREGTILTRSSQKRAIAIDEVAEARKRIKQMEEGILILYKMKIQMNCYLYLICHQRQLKNR
jgi:U2 small nuclear ribonucleoprotein B''